MAITQEFYGELTATGERADTGQQSCAVLGSDGTRRFVNFVVHGGSVNVDLTSAPANPNSIVTSTLTAYIYRPDGTLDQAIDFPSVWAAPVVDTDSTESMRRMQAVFAVAPADYISGTTPAGGYAYVLYGPGVELKTFNAGAETTACGLPGNFDTTPDPDPLNRIVLALAPYKLKRLDVVSGAITDFTPSPMSTVLTQADLVYASGTDYIAIPPLAYKQMFYACTSCILAYGDQVWWGHEEPTKFPTTAQELQRYSGGTTTTGGIEQILDVTFPTSTTTFSSALIIKHQLGARHTPMETFNYVFVPLSTGSPLTINHPAHFVSHVHPFELPSQDSIVYKWAADTVDLDPGPAVDPQAQIPDNANVGDRYNMISGCVSVDTPFLFSSTQRGVTIIDATEDVPNPLPSATQFVVPIRDGSGLSKDWRWYQNMAGSNPFYGVPSGVIHMYLVDPVLSSWKYMGPAMEASGATGSVFYDTAASGPFLCSQRTSKIVNLDGVLSATCVFGAMLPTKANALRDEQHGSSTTWAASIDSAVGFTEELWLICSNDGTNWVKVAKLTERWQDLAADKKGDSISLTAGSTKLIGYGPRNLPIASAPCLLRKPVI